jgi:hypothetical protein
MPLEMLRTQKVIHWKNIPSMNLYTH